VEARSHTPRGALDRATLAALIEEGLTVRQIAARVDRSPTTVRYWIRAHDLPFTTRRGRRPRTIVDITEGGALVALCPTHGAVEHGIDSRRHLRCLRCRSAAVARRRRKVKEILVAEAGGRCAICGYDRCLAALEFHHVDPTQKAFQVSSNGGSRDPSHELVPRRRNASCCARTAIWRSRPGSKRYRLTCFAAHPKLHNPG